MLLGKRPRQIQRTTSMSQLARPPVFAEHALDGHATPSGSGTNPQLQYPNSAGVSQEVSIPSCGTQDQRGQLQVDESVMGDEATGMNPEHDSLMQNGLLYTEGTPMMQQSLGVDALGQTGSMHGRQTNESFHLPPESGRWVPFMGSVPSHPVHVKSEAAESIRPADFLQICFFCKRRLGHERDIFMYMGDIASCSEECRNQLIVSDERRSISASQNGSTRRSGRVVSSETAVAA